MLVFDDNSTSDMNREHVLERLSMVSLPAGLVPQMGTDWSPVGQIYCIRWRARIPPST